MSEALRCLTALLLSRKRLEGLEVVRETCHQNCPLGRICLALQHHGTEIRHDLGPEDDLRAVAMKLAGTGRKKPSEG